MLTAWDTALTHAVHSMHCKDGGTLGGNKRDYYAFDDLPSALMIDSPRIPGCHDDQGTSPTARR